MTRRGTAALATAAAAVLAIVAVTLLAVGPGRDDPALPDRGAAPGPSPADEPACDLWASPGGDDGDPGSRARPVRTLDRLLQRLAPGGTGCLRAGRYDGAVEVVRDGITLRSAPGERATLTGTRLMVPKTATGVTVRDLDLEGAPDELTVQLVGDGFVLEDNDITNAQDGTTCVLVGASDHRTSGGVIRGNVIHGCGETGDHLHHAIYAQNVGPDAGEQVGLLVEGNLIHDVAGYAVQLYPVSRGAVVRRNVIDGGGRSIRGGIVLDGTVADDHLIEDNVIARTRTGAVIARIGRGNVSRGNCLAGNDAGVLGEIDSQDDRVADDCADLPRAWARQGWVTACTTLAPDGSCGLRHVRADGDSAAATGSAEEEDT